MSSGQSVINSMDGFPEYAEVQQNLQSALNKYTTICNKREQLKKEVIILEDDAVKAWMEYSKLLAQWLNRPPAPDNYSI